MAFLGLKTIFCVFLLAVVGLENVSADYKIGVGRADVTGPVAEIIFMGYAKINQKGCGLHLRQFSRAFVIENDNKRILFVSVDAAMVGISLKRQILERLSKRYGDLYNEENFILSGTHTHSGPGGYMKHLLFDIPVLGFLQQSFDALVSGITRSVVIAHENMIEGEIYVTSGELLDGNINRSPAAYLYNPENERSKYKYNVDKEMVQLKFVSSKNNEPIGMISWFPVHPTSMNNSNCLVSSDNVGYASVLMEMEVNGGNIPGRGPFVAAFASSNLGDVSPNTNGPRCINTGEECDAVTSTCNGEAKYCIASGPGKDIFESTKIIATRLFNKAKELWENTERSRRITGPLKSIHKFADMPTQKATYTLENGTEIEVRGCLPAMGYSFAAGTTDGPGEFDFTQGTTTSNPLWNSIRNFLAKPTKDDIKCHYPKPILLMTGRANFPYPWQPRIVSVQMFQIGDFMIAAVPGEFTTMSGRRLRSLIKETAANKGVKNVDVVVAGLSNMYTDYIATPEEYQLQRYEAASTIYGPHTLTIYLKLYKELTEAMLDDKDIDAGPNPPDFTNKLVSFITPVIFDSCGWNEHFGDCIQEPKPVAKVGETVVAKFVAGHPRNNLMHGKTFLTVEKLDGDKWFVVATDTNWETRFKWSRPNSLSSKSVVEIQWDIGDNVEPGTYRIRHFGNYKYIFGGVFAYKGVSKNFKVVF